ncbi:preprotein translocase subunit SecE [Patescibacteria group bacterium]|nr:preprotein translocase subunit SecE [Patescibacteria group bacterium]
MSKAFRFFIEVWQELGKVTWPTRAEATKMILTVVIASAVIAVFIGSLDFALVNFISRLLGS